MNSNDKDGNMFHRSKVAKRSEEGSSSWFIYRRRKLVQAHRDECKPKLLQGDMYSPGSPWLMHGYEADNPRVYDCCDILLSAASDVVSVDCNLALNAVWATLIVWGYLNLKRVLGRRQLGRFEAVAQS